MSNIHTLRANGIDFAYLSYGEGPLILCLHGFPDSAYTWEHLGPRFAEQGYRVVAPFMRGYFPSTIPADHDYSALKLGEDVLALIEALGEKSAVVIGHDWGAMAAYTAASLNPSQIHKLITLAIPHPRSIKPSLKTVWKIRHFLSYQFKGLARRSLQKNQGQGVDEIYRRWSPGWDFAPSETAFIKEQFRHRARLDAALGYYWSFGQNLRNTEIQRVVNRKTEVPTLCLLGAHDGALVLDGVEDSKNCFVAEYHYQIIPQTGHFLHREDPESVLNAISSWLDVHEGKETQNAPSQ